jgi:hypothetical protein
MRALAAIALFVASAGLGAVDLPDPTRPPAAASAPASVRGAPGVRAARVTAVFVSSSRRAAVFDGKVVSSGDRVGDCLVEEVLDDGVLCRTARGTRVERLPRREPAFSKKPARASAAAATGVKSP